MTPLTVAGILKELEDIVGGQLQVVTYKWLGRHFSIPYDTAKRILFEFLTRHRQKVKATFLLSGWTSEAGEAPRHVVRVIEGQQLEVEKAKLEVVTGMHVYSVQPGIPKDAGDLYNADYVQTQQLFAKLLASTAAEAENNLLVSNLLNAVQCPDVQFDPALAARRPRPASAEPAAAAKVDAKPAPVAAGKSGAAGRLGGSPPKAAAGGKKPAASPSGGKKSGGGNLANMFKQQEASGKQKKAAADKEAAEKAAAEQAAAAERAAAAAQAAAASPAEASADSWSSEEEDEPAVVAGRGKKSKRVLEESDSEEEEEAPQPPAKGRKAASKAADKPGGKKAGGGGAKKASGGATGSKRKKPAKGEEEGEGDAAAEAEATKPSGPKYGTVKVRDNEPGAKRMKRVFKTYYNSDGEEVHEETMVEAESDEEGAAPAPKQQQEQAPTAAPKPAAPAAAPAKHAAPPKPAGKPAAGSGGSKKGGKAVPAGQKGIMSFFAKKS